MFIITAWRSYVSPVLGVVILSVCPSVSHTRALLLCDQSKEPTGDIFILHFNYSKYAVENRLSKFEIRGVLSCQLMLAFLFFLA